MLTFPNVIKHLRRPLTLDESLMVTEDQIIKVKGDPKYAELDRAIGAALDEKGGFDGWLKHNGVNQASGYEGKSYFRAWLYDIHSHSKLFAFGLWQEGNGRPADTQPADTKAKLPRFPNVVGALGRPLTEGEVRWVRIKAFSGFSTDTAVGRALHHALHGQQVEDWIVRAGYDPENADDLVAFTSQWEMSMINESESKTRFDQEMDRIAAGQKAEPPRPVGVSRGWVVVGFLVGVVVGALTTFTR